MERWKQLSICPNRYQTGREVVAAYLLLLPLVPRTNIGPTC